MAKDEEPTGFEWLDRPFMMTRILVTLIPISFFALSAHHLITTLIYWPSIEPRGLLVFSILCLMLPALSLILTWQRPRMGFLLAGFGVCPFLALIGWPAAWLCFSAWKVGPSQRRLDDILSSCD